MLSQKEKKRYHRQIILHSIGERGQESLKSSRVLVIGSGGLASPVCFYLTAAGVGTIGIADCDVVELSNLQRQILHTTHDIGKPKTQSARETLYRLNPHVHINTYPKRLTEENIIPCIQQYHLVVDAVDNFPTRYLVNQACLQENKPLIEAGIMGFDGQILTIIPGHGPCYNCLFPRASITTDQKEIPVLGAVAGIMGSLQAIEAVKVLLQLGKPLTGRLLLLDGLNLSFQEVLVKQDENCTVCGQNKKDP